MQSCNTDDPVDDDSPLQEVELPQDIQLPPEAEADRAIADFLRNFGNGGEDDEDTNDLLDEVVDMLDAEEESDIEEVGVVNVTHTHSTPPPLVDVESDDEEEREESGPLCDDCRKLLKVAPGFSEVTSSLTVACAKCDTKMTLLKCKLCTAKCTATDLWAHINSAHMHSRDVLIACDLCDESFTARYMRIHKLTVHDPERKTALVCMVQGCRSKFLQARNFNRHLRHHQNLEIVKVVCRWDLCGRVINVNKLRAHLDVCHYFRVGP